MPNYKVENNSSFTKAFPLAGGDSVDILPGKSATIDCAVEFSDAFIEDQRVRGCIITGGSGGSEPTAVVLAVGERAELNIQSPEHQEALEKQQEADAAAAKAQKEADEAAEAARVAETKRLQDEADKEAAARQREANEREAADLGLVFTNKTTDTQLQKLINNKKAKASS